MSAVTAANDEVIGVGISTGFWPWVLRDQYIAVRSRLSTAWVDKDLHVFDGKRPVPPGGKDIPRGIVSTMVAPEASVLWESSPILLVFPCKGLYSEEGSWARSVDAGWRARSRLGCQLDTVDDFASVLVRQYACSCSTRVAQARCTRTSGKLESSTPQKAPSWRMHSVLCSPITLSAIVLMVR